MCDRERDAPDSTVVFTNPKSDKDDISSFAGSLDVAHVIPVVIVARFLSEFPPF